MEASDALASFALWELRGFHEFAVFFQLRCFLGHQFVGKNGLGTNVASGTPSSSSSELMYVKVPDPTPNDWLVKYSILTHFVPSVVSTFTSKTMMDP